MSYTEQGEARKALGLASNRAIPMTALSAIEGVTGAYSQYVTGKSKARIAKLNRRFAEMSARDVEARGLEAEAISRGRTKKLLGSQKVAAAAQGIKLGYGSAQDIGVETYELGELEALDIRNTAARQAYGFRQEALRYKTEGRMAEIGGKFGALQSLLTTGLQGYKAYKGYK